MGIIGAGRIGSAYARMMVRLGAEQVYCSVPGLAMPHGAPTAQQPHITVPKTRAWLLRCLLGGLQAHAYPSMQAFPPFC